MSNQIKQPELLKCSERIYSKYRKFFRDNGNDSNELIAKKLTRNSILATECWREGNIIKRKYGCMQILIDLDNYRVIDIHNNRMNTKCNFINTVEKAALNKILEIRGKA